MAERRMFTKKITDDDHFTSLSSSAQALYFHLSMSCDDDGFSNQVSISMFKAHASVADLEQLLKLRYIYQFDNGVIVIKHWRMANILRKDRYTETTFKEQLAQLKLDEHGTYTFAAEGEKGGLVAERLPDGCRVVANCLPQEREGEDKVDKDNIIHSVPENEKRQMLGGTLGGGVVMLSDRQIEDLLEKLSLEEFEKYVDAVRRCEESGKHYTKKTHYQAILDMAEKDRRLK